ncbi:MAG: ATP-binding cassette domain-containing protein, partial [Planctomycetales bacterium]|nr:ATP-binding cassette domain-containing protein [Planctomycetales bacterium]
PLLPDGRVSNGGRSEASDLLRKLGLGERLTHRPSQLSGGEQQRVALARALVRKPKLLLADEPTGNLDSETGRGVMEALRAEVKSRGMTAVIVTHAREHIREGDRVLSMRDGRVTEDGR